MKKRKHLSTIILIVVFLTGLSILLYPNVSDYWNRRTQTQVVADYESILSGMSKEDFSAYFEVADAYNVAMRELSYPFMNYEQVPGYEELLHASGSDVMGYITIEKIGVQLPIYHGISTEVLNRAVGHLQGSSLPVGGESTHAVLSAHRGLPSAKLFSNLDRLEEGDRFTIRVLNRLLTYEVDLISIVEPKDTDQLLVQEGKDYCTLVTCTPYGVNTHRLLVRGVRVENDRPGVYVAPEAYELDSLLLAPVAAAPMLLILLIVLLVKYRKKPANLPKRRENRDEEP